MTNYSPHSGHCMVSYYKPSGKWYMDEQIDMEPHWNDITPVDAVRSAILSDDPVRGARLLEQFIAVVAEPYHQFSYPVMLVPQQLRTPPW